MLKNKLIRFLSNNGADVVGKNAGDVKFLVSSIPADLAEECRAKAKREVRIDRVAAGYVVTIRGAWAVGVLCDFGSVEDNRNDQ